MKYDITYSVKIEIVYIALQFNLQILRLSLNIFVCQ